MAEKANAVFEVIEGDYGISVDDEEGESIYNLVPTDYPHYDLLTFEWLGFDEEGSEWAVGTWDEVYEAAKESLKSLYDDVGLQSFNPDFLNSYIDEYKLRDILEDIYENDVDENPEIYFDKDELPLADWQESKIEKLEEEYEGLEEIFLDETEEQDDRDAAEERMEEIADEIQEIKDDPQGEPTYEMVEDRVNELVEDRMDNPRQIIDELGLDIDDFIDIDKVIEDTIDIDGTGHTLSGYDGSENEAQINGTWYYVYRTN